ncbi:MAG TPA: ribosome small subunit-dependent GTPase A [Gaiellaceae bacterium]|nr:ribosome small subunit-dependent GTPase A [Gaiellaceae bacterium]
MDQFDLGDLGWSPELARALEAHQIPARVVAEHRRQLAVHAASGELRVRVPGRFHHEGVDVAVGDWVAIADDAVVQAVLPRRSAIVRTAAGLSTTAQTLAANVDVAFVVSSLGPDVEPRRIERYLVSIWESGAAPEIVLTKADRLEDPWPLVAEVEAAAVGVPVHVVSARTGQGCDALRARLLPGTTAVLLGSSGVGKSTLVNRWLGETTMATNETRADDDEGRHTTTHRQLLHLPGGGMVIDTPGLRELQLWDVGEEALGAAFADVEELAAACRFNDCSHTQEPGCAVLAAVETGELPGERLASWRKLQRELRAVAVRHDARLRKEEGRKWHLATREARARSRLKSR